ncbi:MAG: shikimate dehydrogenase, partial [Planctomycetota bacterium]
DERTVVFDTVYNPLNTRFLALAESAGCRTIDGVDMFVRQAAAQFEAWTDRSAPRDAMRSVVLHRLSK